MMIILVACVASTARDQVNSAPSPDGEVNAVLFETNGGATTSFGYEVELRDTHDANGTVAKLYGAVRNAQAWGVNLRWTQDDTLTIEYLSAKREWHLHNPVQLGGRSYRITILDGIEDRSAPSGGMLYNLKRKQDREK